MKTNVSPILYNCFAPISLRWWHELSEKNVSITIGEKGPILNYVLIRSIGKVVYSKYRIFENKKNICTYDYLH